MRIGLSVPQLGALAHPGARTGEEVLDLTGRIVDRAGVRELPAATVGPLWASDSAASSRAAGAHTPTPITACEESGSQANTGYLGAARMVHPSGVRT